LWKIVFRPFVEKYYGTEYSPESGYRGNRADVAGDAGNIPYLIPTLSSGGGERQLVNLVSSTSKEIVNHIVCVIGEADFFAPNIREAGCKVIEFEIFAKHPFLRAASKFRRIVREEKPDIIHSWLYDANVSARLGNLLNGKTPIVTSLQSSDYEPEVRRIGNYNPKKVRALQAIDKFSTIITNPF